ncbi:GntR family transcriptional regulator [Alteromonas oceanisediminis]|uniref:GntR family transcriptional regulator n=1 Tax=Alteromonas oceanisediminis TaxID=2836180 RepID=UPI001BDA2764|nr:GntR family transcriptional regulator [Alteromonas oceanisediminis]MBT0585547.1 GntR family transcriptional regulator [Alteromonas oceanisediminis]
MLAARQKLSDVITEKLESMILDGSWLAGEQLPSERELAQRFDVSRPSLREAIQNLQARGLVTRKQGGGTFVSRELNAAMTDPLLRLVAQRPETQFDLLEFRHALEGMAAYYAALRGQKEDRQALRVALTAVAECPEQPDHEAQAHALGAFYLTMAKASHNMVLMHVMRTMQSMLIDNIRRNLEMLSLHADVNNEIHQQREKIVAAIEKGDPGLARTASNTHLAFIESTLLKINQRDLRMQRALRRIETE